MGGSELVLGSRGRRVELELHAFMILVFGSGVVGGGRWHEGRGVRVEGPAEFDDGAAGAVSEGVGVGGLTTIQALLRVVEDRVVSRRLESC